MNESLETSVVDTPVQSAPSIDGNNFTLSAGIGLFNIMAGLMLVAAFLSFFGGAIAYLSRLGLEGRVDGLMYMLWGVRILFVLVVLLGVVQYVQYHTDVIIWLVAFFVLFVGGYVAFTTIQASGASEEDD